MSTLYLHEPEDLRLADGAARLEPAQHDGHKKMGDPVKVDVAVGGKDFRLPPARLDKEIAEELEEAPVPRHVLVQPDDRARVAREAERLHPGRVLCAALVHGKHVRDAVEDLVPVADGSERIKFAFRLRLVHTAVGIRCRPRLRAVSTCVRNCDLTCDSVPASS
jgi:hypothetical protein